MRQERLFLEMTRSCLCGQEIEPAPAFSCSLGSLLPRFDRPKSLASMAPPWNRRSSDGVDRLSMWLNQVVAILVKSSIFSSCSRVYCSDGVAELGLVDAVLEQGDGRDPSRAVCARP